jgi:hypothetical protein
MGAGADELFSWPDLLQVDRGFRHPQIVVVLQVHPILRGKAKVSSQPNCGICCDGALSQHDVTDTRRRNIELLRQAVGANFRRSVTPGANNVNRYYAGSGAS